MASTRFIQKKDLPEYLANPVRFEAARTAGCERAIAGSMLCAEEDENQLMERDFNEFTLSAEGAFTGKTLNQALAEVEERLIRNALREADSLAGAARLLGITKQNLHYKLQKYKIK